MQLSMFYAEEPPASRSASQDSERDWTIHVATSCSPSVQLLTDIRPTLAGLGERPRCPVHQTDGRDFGSFLGLLGLIGYGFAYRVLDAQYAGLAQRRKRVFVVGCLGDWRRAAAVLFERHSLSGHPAPSRETGKGIAVGALAGTSPSGGGHFGVANSLNCNSGRPYLPIAFDTTHITSAANRSNPRPGDPCHPLAARQHAPAIAFGWQNSASQGSSNSEHFSPTLDKSKTPAVAQGSAVRRLTPRECARLQGFPDDYLNITYRGKPAADGPKYRALGNSWAVPVVSWFGKRIQMVEDACTNAKRAACEAEMHRRDAGDTP